MDIWKRLHIIQLFMRNIFRGWPNIVESFLLCLLNKLSPLEATRIDWVGGDSRRSGCNANNIIQVVRFSLAQRLAVSAIRKPLYVSLRGWSWNCVTDYNLAFSEPIFFFTRLQVEHQLFFKLHIQYDTACIFLRKLFVTYPVGKMVQL